MWLWNMPSGVTKRIRKAKLNGIHQLLAYADDVNVVEEYIDNTKKNTEAVLHSSKEVGLEMKPEETMC
jgi:hypothetical protein